MNNITSEIERAAESMVGTDLKLTDDPGHTNAGGVVEPENNGRHEREAKIEELARVQGWQPLESFEGDPAEWVSAEAFVERGRLYKILHKKNQEVQRTHGEVESLRKAVLDMKELLGKAQEHALRQEREDIKASKIQALRDGDIEKVVELDDSLKRVDTKEQELKLKVEAEKKQLETAEVDSSTEAGDRAVEFNSRFKQWVTDNAWYTSDGEMRADADLFGQRYFASNPEASPDEVFKYVDKKIRANYPEKFKIVTSNNPDVLPRRTTTAAGRVKSDKVDVRILTAEQREVAENFERMNVMSVEDYAKVVANIK